MQIQFLPFPDLSSERLYLRQLALSDENEIFVHRSDPRILKYIGRAPAQNLEEARYFIQLTIDNLADNLGINWAITLKNTQALIGTICLWNISPERNSAELGYILHPDFQGNGYMQEALEKVVEYGFAVMQAITLEAFTHPENAASIRLLEKNNFICTGESDGLLVFTRTIDPLK